MITIDMKKAVEIRKNQLRSERAPLLADLDLQFQRNLESGADNSAVIAEKQRLRDITKLADSAKSIEDLKAISLRADAAARKKSASK